MHITKVKSVNLDKWAPEVVEMYKEFNNAIANFYWESQMPKNYPKPGANATPKEIENFIKDKYLNKKWISLKIEDDPVTMYRTNKKKF